MSDFAAEEIEPLASRDPLSQHGHQQGDRRHSSQQEEELLEPHPLAVFLIALQEELHGGPADAPVAHHVDQVDQHGHERQEESPS